MVAINVLKVAELPALMAEPDFARGRYRPVIQFIMNWNDAPGQRGEMLCGGEGPAGGEAADLALIAAVVHALTLRGGIELPEWVGSHRLDPPATMSGQPLDSEWGRWVEAAAPAECAEHGVYFEAEVLAASVSAPIRPRPYLRASEVPRLMAQPLKRGQHLPVTQLVKDWYSPLADREDMVTRPLPTACPPRDAARIAVVVHALCEAEGLDVPPWALDHRLESDEMLIEELPWDTEMAARERAHAPPACRWHRCWFGIGYFEVLGIHYGYGATAPAPKPGPCPHTP